MRPDARRDALEVRGGLEQERPGPAGGGDQHLLSLHLAGRPLLPRLPQNSPIPAVTPGVGRSAAAAAADSFLFSQAQHWLRLSDNLLAVEK